MSVIQPLRDYYSFTDQLLRNTIECSDLKTLNKSLEL